MIWNLTRRCNLSCLHCYANSRDVHYSGELTTSACLSVIEDLAAYGAQAVIFSGGEPLLRPDLFDLMAAAKERGLYTSLSTNGVLIGVETVRRLLDAGTDYVGVSLDGLEPVHDRFRGEHGAFRRSLRGIRLCRDVGLKVGIRTTLTRYALPELPGLLSLLVRERLPKFYLSHLVYAGRGGMHASDDVLPEETRRVMTFLLEKALEYADGDLPHEIVTGNNDADGVYCYLWMRDRDPARAARLLPLLRRWGGNRAGVLVADIDPRGEVHADPFWSHHSFGNVRERPFSAIWEDRSDPLMAALKAPRRPVKGRCGACVHYAVCGGNTRVRAEYATGDPWAEDPACYLTDEEIGLIPSLSPRGRGAG